MTIEIFDLNGKLVNQIVNDFYESGLYNINWDGVENTGYECASGVYIYKINAGSFIDYKKMIKLR